MQNQPRLGFTDIFCLAAGTMISSGIFILPGIAFRMAGPLVLVSYMLGGLVAFIGVLAIIELTSAMPKAGGDYFFITRTFGGLAGTISGVLSWVALTLKAAFAIFGLVTVISPFVPIPPYLLMVIVTGALVAMNLAGASVASKAEIAMTLLKIGFMVFFICIGIGHVKLTAFSNSVLDNHSVFAVIGTSAMIFVSFGGLINIASMAEEVKDPGRNIPAAMLGALGLVCVLYAFMVL